MILLASPSQETLVRWKSAASGFTQIYCVANFALLWDELARTKPEILLLDHDLPGLDSAGGIAGLVKLSPDTRVIALTLALSEQAEWELFKTGVKGCCQKNIGHEELQRVIAAVRQGELWMRRTLTRRLLDELGVIALKQQIQQAAANDLLTNLTRREHEIASLVGNGESNKQIAQRLAITERTVKAHLTEIFRKLNVADRLKLALLVTGSLGTHNQA